MAIKKSELYNSLWKSCDELRGGMDASQYKDYVLTLLFLKYVSDKYFGKKDPVIVVSEESSFDNLIKFRGREDIGNAINIALGELAKNNCKLAGAINAADFNDEEKLGKGKEMQDRLSRLIAIFADLSFHHNRSDDDDLLGDAYEYLMRHFATESGKSKGQFYTPSEVSRIIAKIIGVNDQTIRENTVYDPACGSGSLLLKVANEALDDMTIYGQEKDVATAALAIMNMILHGSPAPEIPPGGISTLSNTCFFNEEGTGLKTFDFIVANPPFSTKSWQNGFIVDEHNKTLHDPYSRFDFGVPPKKNGDYAFLLHIIASLKDTGKGAVILPHGVLFRGNVEATIRRAIGAHGYIKGIIGLPANLFYGTGIPACIIVLDKESASSRQEIFMIDASKDFMKDGNKNRLRSRDIHKIVDVFNKRLEITGYSRIVPLSEIADEKNDYNLNLPRYIEANDKVDIQDLTAHLKGGIPKRDIEALSDYWKVFKNVKKTLFRQGENPDYFVAQKKVDEIKTTILDSAEYQKYLNKVSAVLSDWKAEFEPYLKSLGRGCKPKVIINKLSEALLLSFADVPLLDKYAVYQHLMDYWDDTMQDDAYLLSDVGWGKAAALYGLVDNRNKDGKIKQIPDVVIGSGRQLKKFKSELVPAALVVERFCYEKKQEIDRVEAKKDALSQEIEEFMSEHGSEGGLLEDAKNDKGKLSSKSLKDYLKATKGDDELGDERALVKHLQKLFDQELSLSSELKLLQSVLNEELLAEYDKLKVDKIKELVVNDKWLTTLENRILGEAESIIRTLVKRIKELEERYAYPMSELSEQVAEYSLRVDRHLKEMGLDS